MKRLIVCCDGTWNAPEKLDPEERHSTNVLRISRAILPSDPKGIIQSVEYVRGIGTGNLLNRLVGGASGKGITSNILQAYQFISNNFEPGDHIYLFGFSRGAYTARSLSGFLYHVGILKKRFQSSLPSIYRIYQSIPKHEIPSLVAGYAHMIDRDLVDRDRRVVPIHFLGVWDTVGALGVPFDLIRWLQQDRIGFHDTELASNVDFAYHALAIHEFRWHFPPTLWTVKRQGQTVEQVWFPGAHSDVGGGLGKNGLANGPLLWMAGRASQVGLAIDVTTLNDADFAPDPFAAVDDSRTGIYEAFPPYTRPIGPNHLDRFKSKSLDEYHHKTVSERIGALLPRVSGSRDDHEREADDRSLVLPEAPAPHYVAGVPWT